MRRNKDKFLVGISGSYGGLNLGDEAILQGIITELRSSLPVDIIVFTRDAEDTRRRHKIEKSIPVRELTRTEVTSEIEQLDLFILGGGGLLYDADAKTYLRELDIARRSGVPAMTYAISAGPLHNPSVQRAVRESLQYIEAVTVRERRAQKILEDIGLHREIIVTADPALLSQPEPVDEDILRIEHMTNKKHLVCMSVREPGPAAPDINENIYHILLANAADFIIERFEADVVFIPMERQTFDMQHSYAVISRMLRPQHAWVLKGEYRPEQVLSLIGHFDFAVGMRLHFLIFAALQGVPFIALPYAEKVGGFLDDMHIQMPPLNLVNSGRLHAYIDRFWD
ncbi:MAG: polysaccharide pyruvyl transferase family protein, partial [Dehalococcoidales bacterium]|nr:polysaccharide pyruvyl transferase family protein [Dehalococcoidales bacterium]